MTARPTSLSVSLLAALGLTLAACGPEASPQALPILGGNSAANTAAAGDDTAATAESSLARDMMWAPTTYEAADDLPTLGGDRTVHRFVRGSDAQLMELAEVLGVSGEIVRDGSSRRIPHGDGALETWDATWFSYWSGRVSGDIAVACDADGACSEPPAPERSANLPTADEARAMVETALAAAGLSLDGAEIAVEDGVTAWYVNVQYRVDGMLVDGLSAWSSVDEEGISDISGPFGTLEEVGDYATISAPDAVDRLNNGWGPQPAMEEGATADFAEAEIAEAPPADAADESAEEPWEEPEPVVVTLTEAAWALTTFWSWDGSGIYLLPAYRYTADGQDWDPVTPAVADDLIAPPPGGQEGDGEENVDTSAPADAPVREDS